jgi:hypothetical protein
MTCFVQADRQVVSPTIERAIGTRSVVVARAVRDSPRRWVNE